jgi:hypothetical protein
VNPANPPTRVDVTFSPVEGGTRVELVHAGWDAYLDATTHNGYASAEGWSAVLARFAAAMH